MKSTTKNSLMIIAGGALAVFGAAGFYATQMQEFSLVNFAATSSKTPPPTITKEPPRETILMFVGDIMLDRGVEYRLKKNKKSWEFLFEPLRNTTSKADLLFGNLESQISDKGYNVGSIYSFRADPESIKALTSAGFDVVSVANNHSFDYTRAAQKIR